MFNYNRHCLVIPTGCKLEIANETNFTVAGDKNELENINMLSYSSQSNNADNGGVH